MIQKVKFTWNKLKILMGRKMDKNVYRKTKNWLNWKDYSQNLLYLFNLLKYKDFVVLITKIKPKWWE